MSSAFIHMINMKLNQKLVVCQLTSDVVHKEQVLPKVIWEWEEHVDTPHGGECTRPLCVLAVQCPLQRSRVTHPWVHYIHTTSVP